jgi:hypothetical protein
VAFVANEALSVWRSPRSFSDMTHAIYFTHRLECRVPEAFHVATQAAARKLGMSLPDYQRRALSMAMEADRVPHARLPALSRSDENLNTEIELAVEAASARFIGWKR